MDKRGHGNYPQRSCQPIGRDPGIGRNHPATEVLSRPSTLATLALFLVGKSQKSLSQRPSLGLLCCRTSVARDRGPWSKFYGPVSSPFPSANVGEQQPRFYFPAAEAGDRNKLSSLLS